MATQSIPRGDVRVEQKIQAPGVTPTTPTLRAVAVGPCYQVVPALENGSPRTEAQHGSYSNVRQDIKTYDFPDPRSNNEYLDFVDDETSVYLQVGSTVRELKRDERFLSGNFTTAATSIRASGSSSRSSTIVVSGGTPAATFTQAADAAELTGSVDISSGANVDGLVLKFRVSWLDWVTTTFSGTNPIAQAGIVEAVQAAWTAKGYSGTIATGPGNFLVLTATDSGVESVIEIDDAASTAKALLGFGTGNQLDYGQAYPPQPGDEFYADGVLLGEIVTVDSDTQVTLDTEHIVYTGTTPGELDASRWYIQAKNLVTPKAATRPTPELYVHPTASGASILGIEDISSGANVDGLTFIFSLDTDTSSTTVTFSGTNPIAQATIVSQINLAYGEVVGSASGNFLLTSSTSTGNTSRVSIGAGTANTALGFVNTDFREGTSAGDVEVAGAAIRSATSNAPLSSVTSTLYVGYRALRKDVTPAGADPKLVSGSSGDLTSLETDIGPFTTQNPLGLAMYSMANASPGTSVYGVGVDSADNNEDGDRSAYLRTFGWLESQRAYALAPLTFQEEVHADGNAHVDEQSNKENSNFRTVYVCRATPNRRATEVVASGSSGDATSTGTMQLESDVESLLVSAGITDPTSMSVSDGVYIMFTGDEKRYNLASANGFIVSDNVSFTVGENNDEFYSSSQIPSTYLGQSWSLYVRGTLISTVGGLPDWGTIAVAHQVLASNIASRRVRSVVPDDVSLVDGEDQVVRTKGYYLSAIAAAEVCYYSANQGKTNMKVRGITQIWKSNDVYNSTNLSIIGYNNYLFVQEPVGSGNPVTRWHQATTDPTSDDTREESITTQLDLGSIILRDGLREFVGKSNINGENFEDMFMAAYNGLLRQIIEGNIWKGAEFISLAKAPNSNTKIVLKLRPDVYYPLNNADVELYL